MTNAHTLTPTRIWALEQAKSIVFRLLGSHPAAVYLFGSCAAGRPASYSDIDIGIEAAGELPLGLIADINEAMEESTIPYYVDIIDMHRVDREFAALIRAKGIRWTI